MRKFGIAAIAVLAFGPAAYAQWNEYHYVKVYYSDATRRTGVGQETMYCTNEVERSGIETEYYRYYNGMCP